MRARPTAVESNGAKMIQRALSRNLKAHPCELQLAGMGEGAQEGGMADEEHEEAGCHALHQGGPKGGDAGRWGWCQPRQVVRPARATLSSVPPTCLAWPDRLNLHAVEQKGKQSVNEPEPWQLAADPFAFGMHDHHSKARRGSTVIGCSTAVDCIEAALSGNGVGSNVEDDDDLSSSIWHAVSRCWAGI